MSYGKWQRDGAFDQGAPLMVGGDDSDLQADEHLFLEDHTKYGRYSEKTIDLSSICTRPVQIMCGLLLVISLVTLLVTLGCGHAPTPQSEVKFPSSPSADYSHAAIASDAVECSIVGTEILNQRGSAVDAAIAASLCLGVVNFHSSGIGGGFFMTIYDSQVDGSPRKVDVLNAIGAPPFDIQTSMANESTFTGGASVAVPGTIRGYWQAHQRYGRLPWQKLFQSSILLAEKGFVVNSDLAAATQRLIENGTISEGIRKIIQKEDGAYIGQGDVLKLPLLAETLRTIAEEGHLIFYDGYLSAELLADLQDQGSFMTLNDLVSYQTEWKAPLKTSLSTGQWTVFTPPPPSMGVIYTYILSIIDGYTAGVRSLDSLERSIDIYHVMSEAFGFAVESVFQLRQPESNVTQILKNLTSSDFVNHIRSLIKSNTTSKHMYDVGALHQESTKSGSSLTVLAPDGGAVVVSMTLNSEFGAGFIGNRTGVLFNSAVHQMNSKKYLTSLCPSLVFDGTNRLKLLIGASGGSRIPIATAFVTMQNLWFGKSLSDSVSKYRLSHEADGNSVLYEDGFLQSILSGLREKGQIVYQSGDQGYVNSIRNDCSATCTDLAECTNCLHAVCDRRKAGEPNGF